MACATSFSAEGVTLQASSAGGTLVWLTPPRSCAGLSYIDAALLPVNQVGDAAAQLVVQFFEDDMRAPDSPTDIDSPATDTGVKVEDDVSTTAATKAFYRIGLLGVLSGGTAAGTIECSVYGSVKQCGGVLGKLDYQLVAGSGAISYVPVGGLHSARAYSTVAAVVRVMGKSGSNLLTNLAYRTFGADREQPGSLNTLETSWDTVSATNGVRFTGTQTPASLAPDTNMWFQLGIALDPAGTDVSAQVQVLGMGAS